MNNITPTTPVDNATTYFNNYFQPKFYVSQNANDMVVGFFESYTQNKESAKALAGAVINTAKNQGMQVEVVLDSFRKLPKGQLDTAVAMFLNLDRAGSSYIGLTTTSKTNQYITRLILP